MVCHEDIGMDSALCFFRIFLQPIKIKEIVFICKKTGLPVEYLTVLRREVNSYQPRPSNLKDFPGVNPETV